MKSILLLIGLTISIISYSQERDTFQPDSIYMVNHVKSKIRTIGPGHSKSRLIYNYDRQGRYIEFILTDNFVEDKIQMSVVYKYDDSGNPLSEIETSHYGGKSLVKESLLELDEKGRVIRNKKTSNGQIVSEETFTYDPLISHKRQYKNGEIFRYQTTYYETPNYSVRFTGIELADPTIAPQKIKLPNGKVIKSDPSKEDRKWDYTFENELDDQGRIIKRKRFMNGGLQNEMTYRYNEKGLLVEKTDNWITQNIVTIEYFEYEFWEENQ